MPTKKPFYTNFLPLVRNHMVKQPKSIKCFTCKKDLEVENKTMDIHANICIEIIPHKCVK